MNGRIYDDTLSRFVQADPIIQDPYKTESLNRYSYVWNNPLNATDPSGFITACDDGNYMNSHACQVEMVQEQNDDTKEKADQARSSQSSSQGEVKGGRDKCSSGECANYVTNNGDVVSINESDVKAFEEELSKEITKGKKDLAHGISYSSMSNTAGNSGGGYGGHGTPTTHTYNTPMASKGGAASEANGSANANEESSSCYIGGCTVIGKRDQGHDLLSILNNTYSVNGIYAGLMSNYLAPGNFWRGQNGLLYSTNSSFYGNGVTGSRAAALNNVSHLKKAAKTSLIVGVIVSAYDGGSGLYDGEYGDAAKSGLDLIMLGTGTLGPFGAIVSGSYFINDIFFGWSAPEIPEGMTAKDLSYIHRP